MGTARRPATTRHRPRGRRRRGWRCPRGRGRGRRTGRRAVRTRPWMGTARCPVITCTVPNIERGQVFTRALSRGNLYLPLEVLPRVANTTRDPPGGAPAMMLTAYDPFAATSAAFRALDQLSGRPGTARPLPALPMAAHPGG